MKTLVTSICLFFIISCDCSNASRTCKELRAKGIANLTYEEVIWYHKNNCSMRTIK